MIERKVIEWIPGQWWVVDDRAENDAPARRYTPIQGPFKSKAKAQEWLANNPLDDSGVLFGW